MLSRRLNFNVLCATNPQLKQYWNETTGKFDFSNQDALIKLTETLIKLDLGYSVKLANNQLCPNYFNRLDYVIFIKDLLKLTPGIEDQSIIGLDIGTSQSCIYPLLCTKYIPHLHQMVATDIIPEFITATEINVNSNSLSLIKPGLVDSKENSFVPLMDNIPSDIKNPVIFTMCNPPFYSSREEMNIARNRKNHIKEETIAHSSELITDGGDYQFIMKLLKDSELFQQYDGIAWFTSLIGNFSTLKKLIPYLKQNDHKLSFGIYRFKSGSFTVRWILFWTFRMDIKPPPKLFNYYDKNISSKKFIKTPQKVNNPSLFKLEILKKLSPLPYLSLIIRNDIIIIELPGNVFSRSYRRSKSFKTDGSVYIFEISIGAGYIIWRQGFDYKVFESFCNVISSL